MQPGRVRRAVSSRNRVRGLLITTLILLSLLSPLGGSWTAQAQAAAAPASLRGWVTLIWSDPAPGSGVTPPPPQLTLTDARGTQFRLIIDDALAASVGGVLALDRQLVTVDGAWIDQATGGAAPPGIGAFRASRITLAPSPSGRVSEQAVRGAQQWVTILCRFADSPTATPHPPSWFQGLLGGTYPGMDHYWREVSYNTISYTSGGVFGWYNLPQPLSYYLKTTPTGTAPDFQKLTDDCTGMADANIFFPNFAGISLWFNQDLDPVYNGWGGSTSLNRDGQNRRYGVTWIPATRGDQKALAHEMGHAFGLPHSSGPYANTYDSAWDVMSGGCAWDSARVYGCIAVHTIAYYKDRLGWIPASRRFIAPPNTSQTITIERLAQPPLAAGTYLLARIPISGTCTQFYTVEARGFAGYDAGIPGEAIVIHQVDTTRRDRMAQVVDASNNGNPNDAGAMWTPGETFSDPTSKITVSVLSRNATSFTVNIANAGAPTECTTWASWNPQGGLLTDAPAAAALNDRVYVFAKGSDNALYVKSSADGLAWTGWGNLGGILTAAPAAASVNGQLYVFAKGSDNALYVKSSPDGSTFTDWTRLGGILTAPPAAAGVNGVLYVFAKGSDNALYLKRSTDGVTWTDWQNLGGILTAAPAATGFQNQVYVFAKGSDNALYEKHSSDGVTFTGWNNYGGVLTAAPAAAAFVSNTSGETLYTLAKGTDNALYERHTTDGATWTDWQSLGGQLVGPPAAAGVNGQLYTFAWWRDNTLYERHTLP